MTGNRIDLRSDTVTRPGGQMREAMARAEVGDDVFGDDPTVNRLEAEAAARMGKAAALFVPSGTMANLASILSHTRRGDEILTGNQSHIFNYEVGGASAVGGVMVHPLANDGHGGLEPADVAGAIREPNIHAPRTALLCLENTHNRCGGGVLSVDEMDALTRVAHEGGLRVHLDGARIFNAAVALGVEPARLARDCDSLSFCLSKGLGCPVGSLVCGDEAFIETARRHRKMLGGGMRQAGILAAAGLYALEHNIERLADDHRRATKLAGALREIPALEPNDPATNIITVTIREGDRDTWLARLEAEGVLAVAFGPQRLRMVTHLDITDSDLDEAIGRIQRMARTVAA